MRNFRLFFLITLLFFEVAIASEAPTVGLLYNTKETHSLTYRCVNRESNLLDCEFTQSSVRRLTSPENLPEKLIKAKEEYNKNPIKFSAEECDSYRQMIEIFDGKRKAPKSEKLSQMSATEKRDGAKLGRDLVAFCDKADESNYLNIVRNSHDREMRTCKVSSQTFKQSFQPAPQFSGEMPVWIAKSAPDGECGIVQLSRFESEKFNKSTYLYWKYIARKAVTNPNGTTSFGIACKGFDENEYVYDWREKEHQLGCDYIKFTVF